MGSVFLLFVTVINSFAATALLIKVVIDYLVKKSILDKPNARSSHDVPTPRGAGLAVMPVLLCGVAVNVLLGMTDAAQIRLFSVSVISVLILCLITFLDDVRHHGLSAGVRLLCQVVAVAVPLYFMDNEMLVLQGIVPLWLDRIVAGIAWLWFINLFNFMDGINGISGVQTISVALGVMVLFLLQGIGMEAMAMTSALMIGCAFGFLVWNWGRAKVFLGDVGSIGLGYLCGFLLVLLAGSGAFWAALIIPLYYLMDATITLIKRALNREKIWEAHRKHYYQAATVKGGLSHAQCSLAIAGVNVLLIVLAVLSTSFGAWMMLPAVAVVYGLMRWFKCVKRNVAGK